MSAGGVYTVPGTLRRVIDADRVVLVGEEAGTAQVLSGTDAVVWQALEDSPDHDRLVDLLARLSGGTAAEADAALRSTLDHWVGLGLLVVEQGAGHG